MKSWRENYGISLYTQAHSILIKCDGGGSNNSNHYIFRSDLQKLVNVAPYRNQNIAILNHFQ
ncbi:MULTISPECIES: ISAzo13-like element transposase-related protein [unclassified Microcoleus]|uniref:ISAzo13-like element transposase-related protein n=1 Tax=unclassified Microcoleus TaxID=2642155 RepID=UPI002FD53EB2